MATAPPPPRPNLAAAQNGVRSNLPSPPPPQALPLLPHQMINRQNAAAFYVDHHANLLSLLPSTSGGRDILPPPPLPFLPHEISNLEISADFPYYLEDLFHPQAATLLREEITRRLETAVVIALPVPDGAYTMSAPENNDSDDEISLPPPEDGLPLDVMIARFLETAACEKAAAADGSDREACAVCLDDMQQVGRTVGVLRCRHGFHGDCIGKWLRKKNTCPLCRAPAVVTL